MKTNERIISYRSQPSSRTTNRRLPRRMHTLRARCGHVRRRRSTGDKLKNDLKFTALQRDAHACMHACQRRHGGQELQWCRRHGMPPGTFLLRFLISNGEGGIIHLEYLLCTGSNPPILIRNYTRHNKPPGITPLPRPTHPDRAGAAHRCHFTRLII